MTDQLTRVGLGECVARYARRFHAVAGGEHHVVSPLGAWLLLALCAPLASGDLRAELESALGADAELAAAAARELLDQPHPIVPVAVAAWVRRSVETEALRRWAAALPEMVEYGPLPSQAGADHWADEHTLGLIKSFPVEMSNPALVFVLASALATRISWDEPFTLTDASELGSDSAWSHQVARVLGTPRHGHREFIAATDVAGDVAVHVGSARDGLLVVSVIADPAVPAADVLASAHDVAMAVAARNSVPSRSLFDLPLGEGHSWMLSELPAGSGPSEVCQAVLPAWSADTELELNRPELGFPAAATVLAKTLELRDWGYTARQVATARYTRTGFAAAAVTAIAILTSAAPLNQHRRKALLRFGHPYAVVAVVNEKASRWHALPVFSAWITRPDEAGSILDS